MIEFLPYLEFWKGSKPVSRLQAQAWHDMVENCVSYQLTKLTKSDNGNILGMYLFTNKDGSKSEYFHWLNDEEKKRLEELLNEQAD